MGRDLPLNVLFVSPYAPTRIRTRGYHFIRALAAAGHRVTVATVWTSDDERDAIETLREQGIAVVAQPLPIFRSAWNCLKAIPSGEPLQAHFSWVPALAAAVRQFIATEPVDVVHVEHLRGVRYGLVASTARGVDGQVRPIVWDSVDCISTLFQRTARQSESRRSRLIASLEVPRTIRYEGAAVRTFGRTVVTSETDRRELQEVATTPPAPQADMPIVVVPNGVDLAYFAATREARQPRSIVVTGKMSYHANATAVVRFTEDVMPAVWSRLPDARLSIVGKDPPDDVRRLTSLPAALGLGGESRVTVTGTVPDLRPYLLQASVAVAPIQYGAGIQNKVLEAMASGTPVVGTPQAMAGIAARDGEHVRVGSNPAELADAIVRVLTAPGEAAALGRAGRQLVEAEYSWTTMAARLVDVYHDARR